MSVSLNGRSLSLVGEFRLNRQEIARIENVFNTRIKLAALTVSKEMGRLASRQDGTLASPYARYHRPYHFKDRRVIGRTELRRSSRGEAPYRQTGYLSQTMQVELFLKHFVAYIGPEAWYGTRLEIKMHRPHIKVALFNELDKVRRILST